MTPAPGRDELREQIAAAIADHDLTGLPRRRRDAERIMGRTKYEAVADAVLPVVDTWVAAHTAEAGAAHTIRRLREQYPENGPLGDRKVAADETPTTEMERLHRLASHRLSAMTEGKRTERDLNAAVARVRALCDRWERIAGPLAEVRVRALRAALDPPRDPSESLPTVGSASLGRSSDAELPTEDGS